MKALLITLFAAVTLNALGQQPVPGPSPGSIDELVGLWAAKKRFGPEARGPLIIRKNGTSFVADMMGRTLPVHMEGNELVFELPADQGMFRGRLEAKKIHGHWYQPGTVVNGGDPKVLVEATPVELYLEGPGRWSGVVEPHDDEFTFYLFIEKQPDGSPRILLRNPQRDQGNMLGVQRLVREGNVIKLLGKRRGQKEEREIAAGRFDAENQILTIFFVNRGLSYDFMRDGEHSAFYARGSHPGRYVYQPPLSRDDGWVIAATDEVGIDRSGIERLVQTVIDTPESAIDTPQVHGIVIVRHRKLVVEEYFHGFDRDTLHNTRSAAKSVTSVLAGAAMQAGVPLQLSSPVYEVMNGGKFPDGLDAQKRSMTLEHLLTMSSGIFCDDNNDNAPGNENGMWQQTKEPDFYKFYMSAPLDRTPGGKAVYCSGDPNLALGMVARAAGEGPLYLFDRLLGAPMKIKRYSWNVDKAANPYGGGGSNFTLRDFAKVRAVDAKRRHVAGPKDLEP